MNSNVTLALRQKVCKIGFLFLLTTFLLLALGLLITAVVRTEQTNIIGGADWPTFQFRMQELLSSALGSALAVNFFGAVVMFFGWQKYKKKNS
jgi:hypothetical protein